MKSSGIPQRQRWKETAEETLQTQLQEVQETWGRYGENTHAKLFLPVKAYIEVKL